MRGKAKGDEFGLGQTRITPAYAGKSKAAHDSYNIKQDHPRMCGEKGMQEMAGLSLMGSPPHVRGKVAVDAGILVGVRITPAYAGKRPMMDSSAFLTRDYPRVCGEKGIQDEK